MKVKQVISIDVGIINLGIVQSIVEWDNIIVLDAHLVDMTQPCNTRDCKLHHTKNMVDRVDHVIQKYRQIFDWADVVLIEKQPIMGLISVEQLFFDRMRDKVMFVHPVSMHAHFGIRHLNYEQRKEFLVNKTSDYLRGTVFDKLERKHDLADAMAMTIYWRRKQGKLYFVEFVPCHSFEQFRYTGDDTLDT